MHCSTCGNKYPSDVQYCPVDQSPLHADATIAGDVILDPLIGQTLDEKYRLDERLGVGGMGTVYRARNGRIDPAVAGKGLNQRFWESETGRVRFHGEAKARGGVESFKAVAST